MLAERRADRYLTVGGEKVEQNQHIPRETELGFCCQNTLPTGMMVREGKYSKLWMQLHLLFSPALRHSHCSLGAAN